MIDSAIRPIAREHGQADADHRLDGAVDAQAHHMRRSATGITTALITSAIAAVM
jgi:hypothetical protein